MAEYPKAFAAGWPKVNPLLAEIYRYWLQVYNIKGSYDAFPLDANMLPRFLADMRSRGFVGGTISQPHKEAAFALAEKSSAAACRLRAVNYVWLEDGVLCGDNSDAQGFAANLDALLPPGWAGGKAVVLGAGYAARAVLEALAGRGFEEVFVAAHLPRAAQSLVENFRSAGKTAVKAGGAEQVNAHLPQARLIVNTGALGAPPPAAPGQNAAENEAALPAAAGFDFVNFHLLPEGANAADIVYSPRETVFLRAAAAAGLKTAGGAGMLLLQAAPGFARWFGQTPRADAALRSFIAAKIPA